MARICRISKKWLFVLMGGLILLHPASGIGQDRISGSDARTAQTEPAASKEPPLEVNNIAVKFEPAGHERVFIHVNREVLPELSSIEGKDPRIVIDIKNISSVRKGLTRIPVQGILIRQIRSNLDHASRKLRIVVDLFPDISYEVEPVFYRAEKIYVLDISEAPAGKKK